MRHVSTKKAALLLAALTATVSPSGVFAAEGSGPLAGSEWVPVEIEGFSIPENIVPFLQFRDEGRVAGNSGCNQFAGGYSVEGNSLSFSELAGTRKMCPQPVMAMERAFLIALGEVRGYMRDGIDLQLLSDDGTTVLQLRQTDWD